jgi:uncharacterized membrane protein
VTEVRRVLSLLTIAITLAYPLALWFGQDRFEPRILALLLLLVALTRLQTLRVNSAWRWWAGGTFLLLTLAVWANAVLPLKLYPVLVNVILLCVFAYSLMVPPSMIERLARIREPELPAPAIYYTRRVTQVWCLFFALNGVIALITTLWASAAVWTIYNGLVAYLLMGLLFAVEYSVRWRFKQRHHG